MSVTQPTIDATIFRAYDIRGIYPTALNETGMEQIGQVLGSRLRFAKQSLVAVGRDGRLSAESLSQALVKGLLSSGLDVIDIGQVATPVVYYVGQRFCEGNSLMVTGSHNPADYNGLKMVLQKQALSTHQIYSILADIENKNLTTGQGNYQFKPQLIDHYCHEIASSIQLARPLKIAIDAGNGVAGPIATKLLKQLGCQLVELYCDVDGRFPNHHPDPSKPENLQDLISILQTNQDQPIDVGIAFDGDGDRIGVIDNKGQAINADRLMMAYAEEVLTNPPAKASKTILFDVKCSHHLAHWIDTLGGKPIMCRTGHSFIKKAIAETQAVLAGEMSGHIFFNDYWYGFDDALYAACRLLRILSRQQQSSHDFFNRYPNSPNTPEINVPCEEGENQKIVKKLIELAHFEGAKVTTIDGLRVDFKRGWGLIRASNTTPTLVLRFEAEEKAELRRIMDQFKTLLRQYYQAPLNF